MAHGPSLQDENSYYVIRRYDNLAQREEMEDTYYASDDWRKGPRERIVALIENYMDIVLVLDDATVRGLRKCGNHFVEIRSYNLKPDTRDEFHHLFLQEAYPLLQRWNVDVVAYGPSLHDEDTYFLVRRFDGLAQGEESENSFYGSDAWQQGPRKRILSLIETYTEVFLALDEVMVQGLRTQDRD